MLTVAEAYEAILQTVQLFPPEKIVLGEAQGLALSEDRCSPVDSPPFNKALMDGFAVRSADVSDGVAELQVLEIVTAGEVPSYPLNRGQCCQIMTGAQLPEGADAVVRVEDTRLDHVTLKVRIQTEPITPGTNVLFRGDNLKVGDCIVPAHRPLNAPELGALAEIGAWKVSVRRKPLVAVLATGNELVAIHQTPGPGQIRNSNETMLVAQICRAGAEAHPLGIARDNRQDLRERIAAGLQADILLLTGGVSAGQLDLVPSELQAAGVRQIFHKIQLKPGKPLWFGKLDPNRQSGPRATNGTIVFGLPGNPVSSLVCFELFVKTAIRQMMGIQPVLPSPWKAKLAEVHLATGDRTTYHPAHLVITAQGAQVTPLDWRGSADLPALVHSNCLAVFPGRKEPYSPGEIIEVLPWT